MYCITEEDVGIGHWYVWSRNRVECTCSLSVKYYLPIKLRQNSSLIIVMCWIFWSCTVLHNYFEFQKKFGLLAWVSLVYDTVVTKQCHDISFRLLLVVSWINIQKQSKCHQWFIREFNLGKIRLPCQFSSVILCFLDSNFNDKPI